MAYTLPNGYKQQQVTNPYQAAMPGTAPMGAVAGPANTGGGYILNPQAQRGQGPHGMVPGQLGLPDPAADLEGRIPNLQGINEEAAKQIMSDLRGELSPDTVDAIQDAAAQWGVQSGMPGSGLAINRGLRDIGLTSEQVQERGLQQLNQLAAQTSQTQTVSPELQTEVAIQNAVNAAAPDPTAAANYAESLFNRYLSRMSAAAAPPRPQKEPESYMRLLGTGQRIRSLSEINF